MTKKPPLRSANRRLFAKILAETGDPILAYKSAYHVPDLAMPNELEAKGKEIAKSPDVRAAVIAIWEGMGLTLSLASQKHLEVLKSKKTPPAVKLDAADRVYKMHGVGGKTDEGGKQPDSILNIFISQREARGLPIPKEILDAEVI